jgi:hypothetical protein
MSLVLGIFISMVVLGAGLAVIVSTRRNRQLIRVSLAEVFKDKFLPSTELFCL